MDANATIAGAPQHMQALEMANRVRLARAELKRRIGRDQITAAEVVVACPWEADSMTIVSTIISLAHSLKMKVVAEGVETEEQSRYLKLLKCDEMQGYLFSKPLPASELTKMLEEHRAI